MRLGGSKPAARQLSMQLKSADVRCSQEWETHWGTEVSGIIISDPQAQCSSPISLKYSHCLLRGPLGGVCVHAYICFLSKTLIQEMNGGVQTEVQGWLKIAEKPAEDPFFLLS